MQRFPHWIDGRPRDASSGAWLPVFEPATAQAYAQARELGLPATRVLPYQAELCFDRKDFAQARALMQELGQWSALPRLHPVVDYWSGR